MTHPFQRKREFVKVAQRFARIDVDGDDEAAVIVRCDPGQEMRVRKLARDNDATSITSANPVLEVANSVLVVRFDDRI